MVVNKECIYSYACRSSLNYSLPNRLAQRRAEMARLVRRRAASECLPSGRCRPASPLEPMPANLLLAKRSWVDQFPSRCSRFPAFQWSFLTGDTCSQTPRLMVVVLEWLCRVAAGMESALDTKRNCYLPGVRPLDRPHLQTPHTAHSARYPQNAIE